MRSAQAESTSLSTLVAASAASAVAAVRPNDEPAGGALAAAGRTIWGLEVEQIHTRFWAAHGVQVVRQGEPSQIVKHAELFLLSDPRLMVVFSLRPLIERLNWIRPGVMFVRLRDRRERGYREKVLTDEQGRFVRFQRMYDAGDSRLARVALTDDREIAQLWQSAPDVLSAWRRLRKFIPRIDRLTASAEGAVFDRVHEREIAHFLFDVMQAWKKPDQTIARAQRVSNEVWKDDSARIDANAKFIGPVWVGAGRHIDGATTVIGPSVVWDDPACRPASEAIQWLEIEPTEPPPAPLPRSGSFLDRAGKRLFDVLFSLLAISLTLWIYPLIMLAVWLDDGWPIFFTHRRETRGGREFPCVKFRSMRRDAEEIKQELVEKNQADGPQFFMDNDPRLTGVGRFLRKYHLDELPQFFNVLAGDMSIVGPRPSPFKENQFCPAWREARLSVRPGITGLWQVKRTRRAGSDFQEWIKYDIEYVEKRNFRLDLKIIWRTMVQIVWRASR